MTHRLIGCGLTVAVIAGTVSGCGGRESPGLGATVDGGTIVIAAPAEAETLLPPTIISLAAKQVVDQIFDHLAQAPADLNTVGSDGYLPQAADSWEWSPDSSAITFRLNPNAAFHDGVPVRAADVAFSYELTSDPVVASVVRSNFPAIDSITTPDSLSVRVRFANRSPERFFQLVSNLWILPRHLLVSVDRKQIRTAAFARTPVGSGPFRFVRWDARSIIELAANTAYHRGRPHLDRVIFAYSSDVPTASNRVAAGEADLVEIIRAETVGPLQGNPSIRFAAYGNYTNGYLLYNLRDPTSRSRPHPILGDHAMRLALSMALDRYGAVRSVYDTLAYPAYGPFVRALWTSDTTITSFPYDTAAAARMLDSSGWKDTNGDGIRDRGGRTLHLRLAFPAPSTTRRRLAIIFQDQWKRAGVDVSIEELDPVVFAANLEAGKFDVAVQASGYDPSPSTISQNWSARDQNFRSNPAQYDNPHLDSLMEQVRLISDRARAKAIYREIYQGIVNDIPAAFLFEPRQIAAMHERIKTPPLRPDYWWANMAEWNIPASERIDRDKAGLPPGK
ncbi:MAG: Oligopeptide-binding protein AppA [Gemmatimonadaceae bacterium]|nr:Oligopeptide-binding protein AppA [Gemmatimonadaceae bacterium]